MAENKTKKRGAVAKYDSEALKPLICRELARGATLKEACEATGTGVNPVTVLDWVDQDPAFAEAYTRDRARGHLLLGDEITRISAETHAIVYAHKRDAAGNPMYDEHGEPLLVKELAPLSADVMAHKRLMVDTLKWKLSKMLPKIYGDKVVQEHTGAGGGPIQMAAVNLKNLNDEELEQMQRLMAKAGESK
jgi:hypothetical protein